MEAFVDAAPPRTTLCLISECAPESTYLAACLEPRYDLRLLAPQAVLGLERREKAHVVTEVTAVLVDWCDSSAAVLYALRDEAHRSAVPLIALCGPAEAEAEQVAALLGGAHYTLTHPLSLILLQAELRAFRGGHRRAGPGPTGDGLPERALPQHRPPALGAHDAYQVGPLTLDQTARRFYVGAQVVPLTSKEFDLMAFLMARVGVCVRRDEILNDVWNIDFDTETNLLDARIYTLRRKLRAYGVGRAIQTVRGVGYLLDPHAPPR